jgi:hypothetical protein
LENIMTLEERYNAASADTYVGRVRALQAAEAGATKGVSFFDGNGRDAWSPTATPAPDEFQDEFTRNEQGAYRYGGAGKVAGSEGISRWLDKSLKIAFEGEGPRTQPAGYWGNNRYTLLNDSRNAGTLLHRFAPIGGKKFDESAMLSEMAKGIISGAPSGPSPAGLGG